MEIIKVQNLPVLDVSLYSTLAAESLKTCCARMQQIDRRSEEWYQANHATKVKVTDY